MKRNNRTKLAALLTAGMLVSVLPSTVFAENDNKPVQTSAIADSAASSEGEMMGKEAEAPVDVAVSKEKAESLARQYVSIPKEYVLQGASFSMDVLAGGKRNVWGLDFVNKVNGKHVGSINVRIHADNGQLLEFNTYINNPSAKPTYPLKVERDEAQQTALQFIDKMAAGFKSQIQYNADYGVQLLPPLTGEVRHVLRYDRIVHDIPYVDNYIELEVDSEGHIMRYFVQWDDTITFPEVETKLTLEQANEKLRAAAQPQLTYIVPYSAQGTREPALSYVMPAIAIDAITGEMDKDSGISYYRAGTVTDTAVTEKPLGEAPKAGTVTEKQATDAVKAAFKLPDEAELSGSNYNEYNDESTGLADSSWYLNWTIKRDGKEAGSAAASVDGKTAAVRSFYIYYYYDKSLNDSASMTLEQATMLAVETVKQHLPWLTHQLYVVKPDPKQYEEELLPGENRSYSIGFVHKVHGAAVEYDTVHVAIDARTGEITNYEALLSAFTYPEQAPTVISKETAADKWLDYYRTELTYRLAQQFWWNGQPIPIEKYKTLLAAGEIQGDEIETKTEAELVYRLVPRAIDESVFLDAETGSWRNRDTGEATQLEKPKALDLEGHWAERQLELMVAYKALDVKDGKVRPNEMVTRGEIIKMLVLARNSGQSPRAYDATAAEASFDDVGTGSGYFIYVESALEQNLIDLGDGSFNPEGKVTRDEMAELIVRALGYNALANYDHIFKATFKDSAQIENKGQAAIVVGLKIMNLADGKFLPKKQVTRAEAAVAFFRYLQARAELQEAPIRM